MLALILPILSHNFVFAETASDLKSNISQSEKQIKALEDQAKKIRKQIEQTSGQKNSLRKELELISQEKKSLQNSIDKTKLSINIIGNEISSTQNKIKQGNVKIQEQQSFLSSLLRRTYILEANTLLELILSKGSFSKVLVSRDAYSQIQPEIHNYTQRIKDRKDILLEDQYELSQKQDLLSEEKSKLDDQNSIIANQQSKKIDVLNAAKNKESIYQANLQKTLKNIKALDQEIRNFESKLKFILSKKDLPDKGSSVFEWPLDMVLITQRFGKTTASGRLYKSGSHSGMDFRAAVGTPVYASADGVVMGTGNTDAVCPKASFGKWVFIEHDEIGLSTTYGHLSKIKVSKGQKVKSGDLIAYSGNTGRSTAPHLHLTVYATKGVNGEQGVRVTNRQSGACAGKSYTMPLAPTAAYLDPIDYLPKTNSSMFKHPSLAL